MNIQLHRLRVYDVILKIKHCFCLDEYNRNDEVESYSCAKRLIRNNKKVPLHFGVKGVSNNNMKQKGLKKIIRQNINVTDIDQVFDVLIICNFIFTLVNLLLFIIL